jgi:hypothetical protein
MPGWKKRGRAPPDALIAVVVPACAGVVKWKSPFYGGEARAGSSASICFTECRSATPSYEAEARYYAQDEALALAA